MKLKCNDGVVREFSISRYDGVYGFIQSCCIECAERFGVHDTKVLKPVWKEHSCEAPQQNPEKSGVHRQ